MAIAKQLVMERQLSQVTPQPTLRPTLQPQSSSGSNLSGLSNLSGFPHLSSLPIERDLISWVMLGHVSAAELEQVRSANQANPVSQANPANQASQSNQVSEANHANRQTNQWTPTDWCFYATLSLAIAGQLKPTAQCYLEWTQKKVVLNDTVLDWVESCLQEGASLTAAIDSLRLLDLNAREQSIALALYGARSWPGEWRLGFDRIVRVSAEPNYIGPLLGCLLGVQGTAIGIPAELRLRYAIEGKQSRSQAEKLVRDWSGSLKGAIVTSPRRIHLTSLKL